MVLRPATGLRSTQASLLMAIATACTPTISRLAEYLVMDFFFSSRRRHTISTRDLSSDVCSSDLGRRDPLPRKSSHLGTAGPYSSSALMSRSEERRVGKECRSRWSPYQ